MKQNALTLQLFTKLDKDELKLPTLPDIAIKVRDAAQDPEVTIDKLVDTIRLDPVLSARLIKYSNTALVRGNKEVTDLKQACMRLGITKVKNLSMALAIEQLFVTDSPSIEEHMHLAWVDTVNMVSHAMAVYKCHIARKILDEDTLFLTAVMYNLGTLACINEADTNPQEFTKDDFLKETILQIGNILGAEILNKWGMDNAICTAVEHWQDYTQITNKATYATFLQLGACFSGYYKEKQQAQCLAILEEKGLLTDPMMDSDPTFLEVKESVTAAFL